jgi:peptide subunit release factor 1 (eRF1)
MDGEFWRDQQMDTIIESIINIFHTEGVELVRLKGLTRYLHKISGKELSIKEVETIVLKLNMAGIIKFEHELRCPHCGEVSYIVIQKNEAAKLCDTCNTFYQIIPGTTLIASIANK